MAVGASVNKKYDDYKFLSDKIKLRADVKTLVYGTDGEPAMEKAMEDTFPIEDVAPGKASIHLRCFDHVRSDIKRYLQSKNVPANEIENICQQLLGSEINGKR